MCDTNAMGFRLFLNLGLWDIIHDTLRQDVREAVV